MVPAFYIDDCTHAADLTLFAFCVDKRDGAIKLSPNSRSTFLSLSPPSEKWQVFLLPVLHASVTSHYFPPAYSTTTRAHLIQYVNAKPNKLPHPFKTVALHIIWHVSQDFVSNRLDGNSSLISHIVRFDWFSQSGSRILPEKLREYRIRGQAVVEVGFMKYLVFWPPLGSHIILIIISTLRATGFSW